MGMRNWWNSTCWAVYCLSFLAVANTGTSQTVPISLQDDGSLVVFDAKGSVTDLVKQGTPRQSVQIGSQSCNVNYGFNSAGKKTILISVPPNATAAAVFILEDKKIMVPPKSALRIVLGPENKIEKMDGNPAETVSFTSATDSARTALSPVAPAPPPSPSAPASTSKPPPPPSQTTPTPDLSPKTLPPANLSGTPDGNPIAASGASASPEAGTSSFSLETAESPTSSGWPGKLLQSPIPQSQMEEEKFYARTEFGPRFVSSMNFVSVSGPNSAVAAYNQKEIAFSTGYRQDLDVGVWLTDWFGLAIETGFALNAVRGNTQGMSVSSTTFWTVPLLAQICFQYPNESGWIPYLNFGFGGGWTIFKVGGINYLPGVPQLSGTGSSINNAYQIAAGVRYRLYEDLSLTLAYKFYGNSQATVNLDNGVQATLGSPVTNSAEVGVNFAF